MKSVNYYVHKKKLEIYAEETFTSFNFHIQILRHNMYIQLQNT